LSEDFFKVTGKNMSLPQAKDLYGANAENREDYKGHDFIKDKNENRMSFINRQSTVRKKNTTEFKKDSSVHKPKNNRRDSILKILTKKGDVTIKDISQSISDVSEKTIQRELLSLVQSGVLKKEGEKRWSRYSLVS
ncbi:MAG: DeoR family transcriptional regulator, partial [Desulfuromonadaceae bacterium]